MGRAVCLLIALICVPTLFADEKDEWKVLKGTWNVEKAVLMGADQTEAFKSAVLTMEEGKYSVNFAGNVDKGTLKLDAAAKPKRVSITSTEGATKDKTIEAIYEIDGDTLKVCYTLEGKDAPKEFESKEGTNTLFVVYKRGKEKPTEKEPGKDKKDKKDK
jgi:uncharacterized protein (TIGR03067 family)